ncbi:MAG TPA: LuxR C-terminal-related transcriptional regulator [Coleofasciculaceae cyanobacterium]
MMMNTAISTAHQPSSNALTAGKLTVGKSTAGKCSHPVTSPNSPSASSAANASLKTSPPKTTVQSSHLSSTPTASTPEVTPQSSPIQRLEDSNLTLLQGVVEGLPDGIMILSDCGELTYDNSCARQICQQLLAQASGTVVPAQVWRCCQALIESRSHYHSTVIVEDEILTATGSTIRIRVRWLDPHNIEHPYLLVTLEDQQQSAQYRAYAEAQRYGLTDRETQVWLLKRAGLTYKAIGAKLHIAEDTVKKHIKNIHARRDAAQWAMVNEFSIN